MSTRLKYVKAMERVWLIMTIVLLIIVTYQCVTINFETWGQMYALPAITLFAYVMRRFMRRKIEKSLSENE